MPGQVGGARMEEMVRRVAVIDSRMDLGIDIEVWESVYPVRFLVYLLVYAELYCRYG